MHFNGAALFAAGLALAQVSSAASFSKRTVYSLPPSTELVSCGSNHYSSASIQAKIEDAQSHKNPRGYPKMFGNTERLSLPSGCRGSKLMEFPVYGGSQKFYRNDGSPPADRVLYLDGSKMTYCGLITKSGSGSSYKLCH